MSNFDKNLTQVASTRDSVRLAGVSQQALQKARAAAEQSEYEAAQDVAKFGIAGR